MSKVRALVLTGFGLNCDCETAYAFKMAGADAQRIHLNSLISGDIRLRDWQILAIGGGFSWGDDHGAGVVLALRLKHKLKDDLMNFLERGGLILGICNGFQVLVNLGMLPGFERELWKREVALIANDCGNFRDQWVHLLFNPASPCVFTRGIQMMELPIRHAEGKFYTEPEVLEKLRDNHQIALRYATADGKPARGEFPANPNGSMDDIAGICDPSGRVFGLMPHPEAYNHWTNHPDWTREKEVMKRRGFKPPKLGDGIKIFKNAVDYFK